MNRNLQKILKQLSPASSSPQDQAPGVPYVLSPSKARRKVAHITGEAATPTRRSARLAEGRSARSNSEPIPRAPYPEESETPARKRRKSTPAAPAPAAQEDETAFWLAVNSSGANVEDWSGDTVSAASDMSVDQGTIRGGAPMEGGTELYRPPPGRSFAGKPPPGLQATGQLRLVDSLNQNCPMASSSRDVDMRERSATPTPGRAYVGSNVLQGSASQHRDVDMRGSTPFACSRAGSVVSDASTVRMHVDEDSDEEDLGKPVLVPRWIVRRYIPWILQSSRP